MSFKAHQPSILQLHTLHSLRSSTKQVNIAVYAQCRADSHHAYMAKDEHMERVESIREPKSISTVELENFTAELLFTSETLDACEKAIDEVMGHKVATGFDNLMGSGKGGEGGMPSTNKQQKLVILKAIKGKIEKRKKKKQTKADERWKTHGHLPQRAVIQKYIGKSQGLKTTCALEHLNAKYGGYCAMSSSFKGKKEIHSLQEAIDRGFTIIEYNGSDRPIVDSNGRILAVLNPPPNDSSYHESVQRAFSTMEIQSKIANFSLKDLHHTRGDNFAAINVGLSYGMGHSHPSRRDLGNFEHIASALLSDEDIQRLASYQDAMYALWHPKAYRYYKTNLDKLWEVHPELSDPLFSKSIMPTAAFNLGERVATKIHVDAMNCPFGWCIVTALGDFNSNQGGHLILWELGLALEFPAGACICLPSAIITHSNIPTREGDKRMSFTQYCPGEIFRYIENGFRTDRKLENEDPAIFLFRKNDRRKRLQEGYLMFSTISNLILGNYA